MLIPFTFTLLNDKIILVVLMIDLDLIKDNTILITSNNEKINTLNYLNNLNSIYNIKFMNIDEVKKHLYFDYDENTVLYLMNKYKLEKNVACTIIENLYYIEDKEYSFDKLNYLKDIKNELIDNNLLYFDKMFLSFLKNKNIICYGLKYLTKFEKNMLDKINALVIFEKSELKKLKAYEFYTLEEEVEFVVNKILNLINDGVDIKKIKICNVDSKYDYTFKRFSKMFNIPISINEVSLYSSLIVKDFINILNENKSFSTSLDIIKEKYDNTEIYNKLLNLCNKYNDLDYDFDLIIKSLVDDLSNLKISNKKSNEIEIIDLENCNKDDYIFLMNFNQGNIPKLYKDTDYISDYYKKDLLIDTTEDKNNMEKEFVVNKIMSLDNLFITYKLKGIDSMYYPSNLINELDMDVLKENISLEKCFSKNYNKIKLAKYLDSFIKYGVINDNLNKLYSNYDINYLTYINNFNGINTDHLLKYLSPKLTLSYTHINNFYHCAFRYYLTNILKLDKFEESFAIKIGNLFHEVLSKIDMDDFDYSKLYDLCASNMDFKINEKFFVSKLKREFKYVVDNIKELEKETGLTNYLLEKDIYIDKSSNIPVTFMGKVDKIMFKNNLVSIIDYKTGVGNINIYDSIYGLSLQLPVYLYLVKKSNLIENPLFCGFYLQPVLSSEVNYSKTKTYLEQKYDNLKLVGYSNSDISTLEKFVPDYENSKFVKSLKTSSNGFYSYSKIISDEQINNLIELTDKKIDEARDNILSGDFSINPKEIDNKKVGCENCKFKDICFVKEEDFEKLEKNNSLSFLGGGN